MAPTAKKHTLSLDPDDAIVGEGLFGAGEAVAVEHRFGYFKYPSGPQAGKKVTALLVKFTRDGEKHTEAMTVGKGFKPADDGLTLQAPEGVGGLPTNCKMLHYVRSIKEEGGATKHVLASIAEDISVLDGIEGTLIRKPMEKGSGLTGNPTILIWDSIESVPWNSDGKKKAGTKKAKPVAADDDDDDDDEPVPVPVKKGKAVADDDDDDDDADDEETATEALIEALDDGPLKLAKVEAAVAGVLKKHKRRDEASALAATPKFLKGENGWEFDGKTVSLP